MSDFDGMEIFVAVVEKKGFRAAAERLGISGPAVSKAVRTLEQRLGVTLMQRTTRSVRLTEAGERLYAAARSALDEVQAAVRDVGELAERPRGTLRLSVDTGALSFQRSPVLEGFLAEYPEVDLDIVVGYERSDIVAAGYDAAVRLGEVIEQDMVAVPASAEQRFVVVGAPAYFAKHPEPRHPRDLAAHVCINFRGSPGALPYRWEFTEDGRDFAVAVKARVVTNDLHLMLRLAVAGAGLMILFEEVVAPYIERGELVPVLEEYCTPFPGFYLYYPRRRHAAPPLRALVEYLRRARRT
jgi:DNA-binding transcriptional LysR family regulator